MKIAVYYNDPSAAYENIYILKKKKKKFNFAVPKYHDLESPWKVNWHLHSTLSLMHDR